MQVPPDPPSTYLWFFDTDWGTFWQIWGAIGALILSAIALGLAWRVARRQFKIMEDQGRVIERQTELLEGSKKLLDDHKGLLSRIETIENEQKEILSRQRQIAERQHQLLEEQVARRPKLYIRAAGQHRNDSFGIHMNNGMNPKTQVRIEVQNYGRKGTSGGFYWELLLRQECRDHIYAYDDDGTYIDQKFRPLSEKPEDRYYKVSGHYHETLFPRAVVAVCTLDVMVVPVSMQDFTIKWRISAEDGSTPDEGFCHIRFQLQPDRLYDTTHEEPHAETPVVVQDPQPIQPA